MDPILEENNVLSEIERTIQNACALFNFKGDLDNQLLNIDEDPIVSVYGSKDNKSTSKRPSSGIKSIPKSSSPIKIVDMSNETTVLLNNPASKLNESVNFEESLSLPFLKDPVKNTVEEIQRVLNAKDGGFSKPTEPSPEEILNLYSKDLGISLDNDYSPRENALYKSSETKEKLSKKDKKDTKRFKQSKAKTGSEIKQDIKKRKMANYEMLPSKESRLKDLRNIYGGSVLKIKDRHSESTLGSKSELSKTKSSKKIKQINNPNKAGSTILSKKSIRKGNKYSRTKICEDELFDAEFLAQERLSKFGSKKKKLPRSITDMIKIQKKGSTKRSVRHNLQSKVNSCMSNNHFNYDEFVNDSNRYKVNNSNIATKPNQYNRLSKKPNVGLIQNGLYNVSKKPRKTEKAAREGKIVLNSVSRNNLHLGVTNTSGDPKILEEDDKLRLFPKQKVINNYHKPTNSLGRQTSKEEKLKIKDFPEEIVKNECILGQDDQTIQNPQSNMDNVNGEFAYMGHIQQQHYTLPTLSSRSKEVERFLNGHYKHLPFVIGQSTNKSHNLWVNIQEALSLINQKFSQNVDVQSKVVNECFENEGAPSISTTLTSKSVKKPHHCPAIISDSLYDIPEIDDAVVKSWEDNPECLKANIDPSCVRSRCSCSIQPVMSYKNVLKQIFGRGPGESSEMSISTNVNRDIENSAFDHGGDSYIAELRKALVSFTEEFEQLNNKYENMLKDPNADKEELERLEVQLQNKEEEIKEILARFNEVKEFQQRSRLEGTKNRTEFCSLEPFKSTTSIRLAQTLHRVQKFKESLKSRPSVPFLAKHSQNLCY